ncbi:MAG: sialidase family protein [Phycisphaerae bacterium]|nr:sialidase family protein [Phycisphaerae bacterium]
MRRTASIALGCAVVWGVVGQVLAGPASRPADVPPCEIVSVKRIWDAAPHNAFTDLIRFQDKWYCTFRESQGHVGGDGKLRVLESVDGDKWSSAALLAEEGVDLRDPKLSITADGRLMMVAGGSIYKGKELIGRRPRVAFSKDGHQWSAPQPVLSEGEWLWRVTWHDGRAYGVSYDGTSEGKNSEWPLTLWSSKDGVQYERITALEVTGRPNETTLRFMPDGEMIALVRRESGNTHGWIGRSRKPYTKWTWHEIGHRLGGPDFIRLPDGRMWAASRSYGREARTVLAAFGPTTYEPVLTFPSGGDCSYPGLVWHDNLLWMSYYSSHEGKSSIYLARVKIGPAAATHAENE